MTSILNAWDYCQHGFGRGVCRGLPAGGGHRGVRAGRVGRGLRSSNVLKTARGLETDRMRISTQKPPQLRNNVHGSLRSTTFDSMSTAHVQMCNYLTKLSTSEDRPNQEENDWGPTKSGLKRTHPDYCRILRTDRPGGEGSNSLVGGCSWGRTE